MAKLYFRYGAMNSGKSTALLQAAHNYEERDQAVILAKPAVDTKADDKIQSRLGVERKVDFLVFPNQELRESFIDYLEVFKSINKLSEVSCLLVDEAQFLSKSQIEDLFKIAVLDNIPVIAYGIRTDFQTVAFPGSSRLLELAHSLEELKTICRCGRKALLNGRKVDGVFVFHGSQLAIDGVSVTYESLCGNCYLKESKGLLS